MCGITGLYDPSDSTDAGALAGRVAAMTAVLVHRGPDADGTWTDAGHGVALGHRRLAVVELGPEGAQPMVSADGRWVLVYNGEVYNHRELRHRLAAEGLAFRGGSDTEVLLGRRPGLGPRGRARRHRGDVRPRRVGPPCRKLHLARDRFGEKPLYDGWVEGRLAFASELKSLATLPGFDGAVDRDAVALYLRHNCVPAPRTAYRHVAKLSPGQS